MTEEKPSKDFRPRISITSKLPKPNAYVQALDGEYRDYAFNEERVVLNKGNWRDSIFKVPHEAPIDLEIGTGNGTHFAHYAAKNPNRCLVGFELKYKPLIQTIRRVVDVGGKNARIARYHGQNIDEVFAIGELNNVFIHFPDPWVTPKKPNKRIVSRHFLNRLFEIQRPGSFVEFKTDSRDYFLWALEEIAQTPYQQILKTLNLHQSGLVPDNFVTTFERIFIRQDIEINYIKLQKPHQ